MIITHPGHVMVLHIPIKINLTVSCAFRTEILDVFQKWFCFYISPKQIFMLIWPSWTNLSSFGARYYPYVSGWSVLTFQNRQTGDALYLELEFGAGELNMHGRNLEHISFLTPMFAKEYSIAFYAPIYLSRRDNEKWHTIFHKKTLTHVGLPNSNNLSVFITGKNTRRVRGVATSSL